MVQIKLHQYRILATNMDTLFIIVLVALPAIIIWMCAVRDLMTRRDDEFHGQNDKLAWAIILAVTGLFGAVAWFICRPRVWSAAAKRKYDKTQR